MGTHKGVSAIQVVWHPLLCLKTTELQLLPLFASFFPEAVHQLSLHYTCVHIYWYIYSHWLGANKMLIYYGLKFAYFIRCRYSMLSVVPGQPFLLPLSLIKAFHCLCLCDWLGWWNRLQVGQREGNIGHAGCRHTDPQQRCTWHWVKQVKWNCLMCSRYSILSFLRT